MRNTKRPQPPEPTDDYDSEGYEPGYQKVRIVKDKFDLSNFHLPTITIASILVFCIWITWSASQERANIQAQMNQLNDRLTVLAGDMIKIQEQQSINTKDLGKSLNDLSQLERIDSELLAKKIPALEDEMKDTEKKLLNNETWSSEDHLKWCLHAQILNPGWKCYVYENQPEGTNQDFRPPDSTVPRK